MPTIKIRGIKKMSLRERNNRARMKSYWKRILKEQFGIEDYGSSLEELKEKVKFERGKKAPPIEYLDKRLDEFFTYKELLEKEENKERLEKSGDLFYGRGGEVVSQADPSPYVFVEGVIMSREEYEEKKRLDIRDAMSIIIGY